MNVIVIVTDSLRRDHVGCYGSHVQTPNIDQLAAEGTVFEEHYSEGLPTIPTRTAFWTGRYTFPFRGWQHFEHDDEALAEVLWDRGYTSAFITDVYHQHKPGMNLMRGFDYVEFIRGQEYDPYIVDPTIRVDVNRQHKLRGDETDALWRPRFEQYLRNISVRRREEDYYVAQVSRACTEWLERQVRRGRTDRLFLWMDCFDPHEPWDPPEPFASMYEPRRAERDLIDPVPGPVEGYLTTEELARTKALYAGEVTLVDKWVGAFLDGVRALGLWENSLIVYTTDHGEPFGEHGIVRKARPWPYVELSHIPLIVRHPHGLGGGQRVRSFTETCDLMPTILDALGIADAQVTWPRPLTRAAARRPVVSAPGAAVASHSERRRIHGQSWLPLMSGDERSARSFGVSCYHRGTWSIRSHEWSYLVTPHLSPEWPHSGEATGQRSAGIPAPELYHRPTDPAEQVDVAGRHSEVARDLARTLRDFAETLT